MSSSSILPGHELAIADPEDIRELLERDVDLVIDGGLGTVEPSTVIDWHDKELRVLRQGAGDIAFLNN